MNGIVKPIIFEPIKHIYKLFTKPNYLTYNWLCSNLSRYKRFEERRVKTNGLDILIPDVASFLSSYKAIFVDQTYLFKIDKESPKILDLGANIGLSILFFQKLYPNSKITAFEADPNIFKYLDDNCHNNHHHLLIKNTELFNKAVWNKKTVLNFNSEGSDGGYIDNNATENSIKVETVDIADILTVCDYDFIKMDIEGAEEFVVPRCQGLLKSVKYMFIEYHSKVGQKQSLDKILNVLSSENFRIYMHNPWNKYSPFLGITSYAGFDFQTHRFPTLIYQSFCLIRY